MTYWRKLHNWIGLLIGLQVLAWISGGVIMSAIPIEMVRGKHLLLEQSSVGSAKQISADFQSDLSRWQKMEWVRRLDKSVIKLSGFDHSSSFIDPTTGAALARLTGSEAEQVARNRYLGKGKVVAVQLLEQIPAEASRLSPPVYSVQFDDWINTTFYVQPDSGEIKTVRSDLWRVYDFFWMLHIMDYEERENFNNPLVIVVSVTALIFTMTGFVLLYFSFIKPQTRIIWRAARQRRGK
ncbi:MAG: hypothetical protein HKN85_04575 [Gammaproteobacteria bacterium]|nr:hypothetical protein [Gammaproteobacteria bacterium]